MSIDLKELTTTIRKAIVDSYKAEGVKNFKSSQIGKMSLEFVETPELKSWSDNSTVTVGVMTKYVADPGSGVPDYCTIEVASDGEHWSVKKTDCQPYD